MKQAHRSNSYVFRLFPGRLIAHVFVLSLVTVSKATVADTIFKCNGNNGTTRYQGTKCSQNDELGKWAVKTVISSTQKSQTIVNYVSVKKEGGTYHLDGDVNGTEVNMVVDTKAPLLSIPFKMAGQLNLEIGSYHEFMSANGLVQGYDTVVKTLKIGNLIINNIPAIITQNTTEILLGQSVLGGLKVEQLKDELRLSAPQ